VDAPAQEGHQQGHRARVTQEALRRISLIGVVAALLAGLLAGCIQPPTRNLARDEAIRDSTEKLAPERRGPVDSPRATETDPPPPGLESDVRLLAGDVALDRIQANNRLRQAGTDGILAAARFLEVEDATDKERKEAIRFISDNDISGLESAELGEVRAMLAMCLDSDNPKVRAQAARALQIHGPGDVRTRFLQAINDTESRVRWSVVRRFGDHPQELNNTQRLFVIGFLDARPRSEFHAADTTGSGYLTRGEFPGRDEEFRRLDRNEDGFIQLEEWISPVDSGIRADVVQLLQRLHTKLTPRAEPIGYNPYAPSADQLQQVALWRTWSNGLESE
jgi:hypothetical protein